MIPTSMSRNLACHIKLLHKCSNAQSHSQSLRAIKYWMPSIRTNLLFPIVSKQQTYFTIGNIQTRNFFTAKCCNQVESGEQHNDQGQQDGDDLEMPLLMDFTPRGMPNFLYALKNFYIINFVIRGQIDKNFDFTNFINGAKQALLVVSSHLANNRLDQLTDLVDEQALQEIKRNYQRLTLAQRKELELEESDIVLSFAHHITVETLKEDFTGTRKHIVSFFIVFDCIRNLEETLREKSRVRGNARELIQEFSKRKYICNYEFKREYIEGGQTSDWIITKLLHIREKDLINLTFLKR